MTQPYERLTGPEKRQNDPIRRTNPFAQQDAMSLTLGRDAKPIARRIGLAGRTVRQWRERYDSDHRGPGETLALVIEAALDLGRDIDEAVAPIRALAEAFGYELTPRLEVVGTIGTDDATLRCSKVLQRACEGVAEVCDAAQDGRIDPVEHIRIRRKIRHLEEETARLKQFIERKAEEAS